MRCRYVVVPGVVALLSLALPLGGTADHRRGHGARCSDPYTRSISHYSDRAGRSGRSEILLVKKDGMYRWSPKGSNVICGAYAITWDGDKVTLDSTRSGGSHDTRKRTFRKLVVEARRPLRRSSGGSNRGDSRPSSHGRYCSRDPYKVAYTNQASTVGDTSEISLTVKGFDRDDGRHTIVTWRPASGNRICKSVAKINGGADSVKCLPKVSGVTRTEDMSSDVSRTGWRITGASGGTCEIIAASEPGKDYGGLTDLYVTAKRK